MCTGDDATMLVFTRAVSDEDVQLVNAVRAVRLTAECELGCHVPHPSAAQDLSLALGSKLGANSDGSRVRRKLATLLVGRERAAQPPPPKPWRKISAAELMDWDNMWAPLLRPVEVAAVVSRQRAKATARSIQRVANRAAAMEEDDLGEI